MDKFPEQFDLLFHANESVRSTASYTIGQTGSPAISGEVIDRLLAVLQNKKRTADHLQALQAIGSNASNFNNRWLGSKKISVVSQLRTLLVDGDKRLLPDTIRVLSHLTAESEGLVIRHVQDLVSEQRMSELHSAAEAAKNIHRGRGGGFF